MKRPLPLLIPLAAVLFSPLLSAQQQGDAQANPPEDSADIVAQVQQLRAEVEQLSEQVDRLNNEIKSMRATGTASAGTTTRSRTASKPSTPAPTPAAAPAPAPAAPVPAAQIDESIPITVLVFRDGQKVETRNYAIVGESIWVYNEQESKKYRVADLDVDKTRQLNSDHGVGFQLPPTR